MVMKHSKIYSVPELLGSHQTSQCVAPVLSRGDSLETILLPALVNHEIRTDQDKYC